MQKADNRQRGPVIVRLGRTRGEGAIAKHHSRSPRPEEVVVEDEETSDAAKPVEGSNLVPVLPGKGGLLMVAVRVLLEQLRLRELPVARLCPRAWKHDLTVV